MRRARRFIEGETSTLVLHLEDPSTDFLKAIYAGKGYPVISGAITEAELAEQIKAYSRMFMLGHGSPSGLFGRGLFIGDQFGKLLAKKEDGLYIWCNADAYAVRNKISGLVSGMFISEVDEAAMFGIRASQREVDASNATFSRIVRETMDKGGAHNLVKQCYASSNAACKITKFNSDRLYVFKQGTPTPALHPSSYSLAPKEPAWRQKTQELKPELNDEEQAWLKDYLQKAAASVASGEADFEDAVNGMYAVLDEYVPGADAEAVGEDLFYALRKTNLAFDADYWAKGIMFDLLQSPF